MIALSRTPPAFLVDTVVVVTFALRTLSVAQFTFVTRTVIRVFVN